jgi:hypothetical protein
MRVEPCVDRSEWASFLSGVVNPTLFHDLNFLAYHPASRFNFHHLCVRDGERLVALLPGAIEQSGLFISTSGASSGGPVLSDGIVVADLNEIVKAVQDYAKAQGWSGIEMTLPVPCYAEKLGELLGLALFNNGFQYKHRWLCNILPLDVDWSKRFSSRQVSYVRAALRDGVTAIEGGVELLELFAKPFRDTFKRHGVSATHTEDEIRDLMGRFPDRIRIHLAMHKDEALAGLLIFHVAPGVGYTMYILRAAENSGVRGDSVVIADTMTRLAAKGFRYLDLGPSASDMNINDGVLTFKERLGSFCQCRDRWYWMRQ